MTMKTKALSILICLTVLFDLHAKEEIAKSSKNNKAISIQEVPMMRLGYTNEDYILNLLPETQQVYSTLGSFEQQLQNQLVTKIEEFKKKLQLFQQGAATMTEAVRNKKEAELQQLQGNLELMQLESQDKLMQKQNSLFQPLREKIQNASRQVAQAHGYDYIIDTKLLLYANEKYDVTELLLQKLGITSSEGPKNSPKKGGNKKKNSKNKSHKKSKKK